MSTQQHHQVIIVGSGPAGLTAAIYTSRANLEPLCIEGYGAGGQLMETTDVENYPGFPEGLMGPEMMQKFRDQAERFGTGFVTADVTDLNLETTPFEVSVGETTYTADSVILSTGAVARTLGVKGEDTYAGYGISYCATCDGFFFRDKEIIVVGGGDSAMEEALFLTKFASKVTILHRRDEYKASHIMLDRARNHDKIEFREWAAIEEFHGEDNKLTGVTIRNTKDDTTAEMPIDGVFVAIGHDPMVDLVKGKDGITLNSEGYVQTSPDSTATDIPGFFACGDVQDDVFRQAVTAAGTGCMAAIEAERWLADQDIHERGTVEPAAAQS